MTTYVLGNILGSGRIFHMETLDQEGVAIGYNYIKPSRPNYHPLLVFDGLSQTLLNAKFVAVIPILFR
jgi:hypothetical protein